MGSDHHLLFCFCKSLSMLLSRKRMFIIWSGHPTLGVLEYSLLKNCMCSILQIYILGEKNDGYQGHPYLVIACILWGFFKTSNKRKRWGEGKERKIFRWSKATNFFFALKKKFGLIKKAFLVNRIITRLKIKGCCI